MDSKWFSKIGIALAGIAMAVGVGVGLGQKEFKKAEAVEAVYKEATFNATNNQSSISDYTSTWNNVTNGFTWTLINFNNNKTSTKEEESSRGSWTIVKCGRKNNASTGTIKTGSVSVAVTKVRLSIDSLTASKINSITLFTSSNNSTWSSAGTFDKSTGDKDVSVTSPAANLYYKIEIDCQSGSSNGLLAISGIKLYYNAPDPVTSLALSGTGVSNNALSIGSSDENPHSITVTINSDATDKQINIIHKSGTNGLFTPGGLTDGHITCNASGVGSFTLTGTGATSGSETFSVTSNGTPAQTVDLVVTALNDSATYYDISMNIAGYALDGTTHILEDGDASITLLANPKFNLPDAITASGAGTEGVDWSYDNNTGDIVVLGMSSNVTISFEANPADFDLFLSGAKTEFKEGDSFSSEGLVVTAVYNDSSLTEEVIESGYTIDDSEFDGNHHGTYTITVSYSGKSETYDVNVSVIVSFTYSGVDSLTRSLIGVTGKNYEDWSGISVSDGSSAVYAGNSAGLYEAASLESIQIRTTGSVSGIVSTTTGGLVTKVSVSWNSETADARTINVYGKNTAYSAASDLYSGDAAIQGTLVGTIVYGTSTELSITGNYAFVGIRSNSGAIYLDGVDFSWSQTTATDADVVVVNNFITTKMQPQIAHNPNPELEINNQGQCDSEGWYDAAKTAFNALKKRQKAILLTSSSYALTNNGNDWTYAQAKARLLAWAAANHESLDGNNQLGRVASIPMINNSFASDNELLIAIIIIAGISTLAIGGYFFIRRKHQ